MPELIGGGPRPRRAGYPGPAGEVGPVGILWFHQGAGEGPARLRQCGDRLGRRTDRRPGREVGAWSWAEEAADRGRTLPGTEQMRDIARYSEVDCKVMMEIVRYLREYR